MLRDPIAVPFPVDQLIFAPDDSFHQSKVLMPTATLTSKGRINLPQAVRHALGIEASTRATGMKLLA